MKPVFIKIVLVVIALFLAANLAQNYKLQTAEATGYQLVAVPNAQSTFDAKSNVVAAFCRQNEMNCIAIVR